MRSWEAGATKWRRPGATRSWEAGDDEAEARWRRPGATMLGEAGDDEAGARWRRPRATSSIGGGRGARCEEERRQRRRWRCEV